MNDTFEPIAEPVIDGAAAPIVDPAVTGAPAEQSLESLDLNQELDGEGNPVAEPAEEFEDVEWEDGKKYSVPKALKSALMKNADYTQKTQKLADDRRALETAQQQYNQKTAFDQANLADAIELKGLEKEIEQYSNIDWQAALQGDASTTQAHWMRYQQLLQQKNEKTSAMQSRFTEYSQATHAQQVEQARKEVEILKRDIPGFNAEKWGSLQKFAVDTYGFTPEQVAQVSSSALVKLVHDANLYHEILRKAKGGAAVSQKPVVKATTVVSSNRGVTQAKAAAEMSDSEWLAAEKEKDKGKRTKK